MNFYRPAKSGNGPNTVERQHINALHDKGRKCDNPRKIFIEDLKKLIEEIKQKTDKILLAGDLNEHVKSREGSNNKICEMGFINILQWQYGDILPPTRHLGREAIDHTYILSALLNITKNAGYLPFGSGLMSDHRPIFIDLELNSIDQEDRKFIRRNLVSTHPTRQKI